MSIKGRYRDPHQRAKLAPAFVTWLLITGFLFQPILTYLATPMLVADRSGNVVLICTLYGIQAVNTGSVEGADDPANQYLCPALSLLHSSHNAQISYPPTIPEVNFHEVAKAVQCPEQEYCREYFHAFLTRGPPRFS